MKFILIAYLTLCQPAFYDSCIETVEVRQLGTSGECHDEAKKALDRGATKAECVATEYDVITFMKDGNRIISNTNPLHIKE